MSKFICINSIVCYEPFLLLHYTSVSYAVKLLSSCTIYTLQSCFISNRSPPVRLWFRNCRPNFFPNFPTLLCPSLFYNKTLLTTTQVWLRLRSFIKSPKLKSVKIIYTLLIHPSGTRCDVSVPCPFTCVILTLNLLLPNIFLSSIVTSACSLFCCCFLLPTTKSSFFFTNKSKRRL